MTERTLVTVVECDRGDTAETSTGGIELEQLFEGNNAVLCGEPLNLCRESVEQEVHRWVADPPFGALATTLW